MNRQQEALTLAHELLREVELSHLSPLQLVLKASRLARLMVDDHAQQWLRWELEGYTNSPEAWAQMKRLGRIARDDKTMGYFVPLAELSGLAEGQQQRLAASTGMSYAGDYASIAAREHHGVMGSTAQSLGHIRAIEAAVVTAVYDFTSRTYYELLFSDLQADLFTAAQSEIDARLAPLSGRALEKIESISERLRDGDVEAVSQAMTTCRRLIDAAANALFPPRKEPYLVGEQPLNVGPSNVLNRLQAHVTEAGIGGDRRDRLRQTLAGLYRRTSAGAHADVDVVEARYVFLQTYVVLGELLQ